MFITDSQTESILHTTDAWASWSSSSGSEFQNSIGGDVRGAFVVSEFQALRSIDEGATWQPMTVPREPGGPAQPLNDDTFGIILLRAVRADGEGHVVMAGNVVYHSNNDGETWSMPLPFSDSPHFFQALTGRGAEVYAVGDRVVGHSIDHGQHWSLQRPAHSFGSAWLSDDGTLWAISGTFYPTSQSGDDPAILRSRDQGASWTIDPVPGVRPRAIWGSGWNNIYVAGEDGLLLQKVNGGRWERIETRTKEVLEAVYGFGCSDVFVVGSNGTVLRGRAQR